MKLEEQLLNLRHLDELAAQDTVIHKINPSAKLVATLSFIIVVTSFPKYEIAGLLPLLLYPVTVISLGNLPVGPLLQRLYLTVPFILFIGIFNPLLDRTPFLQLGPIYISNGWISFFSIFVRSILAITAALTLIATTGMDAICTALLRLRVPRVFVIQLLFMYRYLYILLEETCRAVRAHNLRSLHDRGIGYRVWGSLIGQLLLRTLDRAQRIYLAMLCRGFDGTIRLLRPNYSGNKNIAYVIVWVVFFIIARSYNIPHWIGSLLTGGYK
jgi:cobalt/nickel transport system permease protein